MRLLLAASVLLSGCGKKNKPPAAGGQAGDYAGGFVDIDFSDEERLMEELGGSELVEATAACGDLLKLETAAIIGQLSGAQIKCLDDLLRESERQTVKDKISRVLLNDAWAKGDEHRWEGIARRHLETIDRSDPDMCYKFAFYLAERGADKADEAMRWADIALDNRAKWEGDLHVKRVYSLMKIRSIAAGKKWTWLESEYTRSPTEAHREEANEARNQAKTVAREWLEYARGSNTDQVLPLEMCKTASGTTDFCQSTGEAVGDPG
jgi:hypothetical protein